jgi:uncharacterized protein YndB with AHSA1/START domain
MKLHNTTTDRIEKEIVLRAPRSRVWGALTKAEQFGAWFGIKLEGDFAPGAHVHGQMTSPPYEHVTVDFAIERMEPESRLSYRWHPYPVEPGVDYSSEPTTLVEFHLEEVAEGTQLKVVESGFDRIPAARRAEAFHMNDAGWTEQLENIARYVAK